MKLVSALIAVAALAITACTSGLPIHNVSDAPIILPPDKRVSMNQISTAIMRAGTRLGWQMELVGPGRITGRYVVRTHLAAIEIEHNTKSYSITYRDSTNLDARGDGTIHRFYNNWILSLEKGIRDELARL